jgi:folate-binding protein YgfZ
MMDEKEGWGLQPLACVLEVTGEDCADFLQSQFSADLNMPIGGAKPGLWLDHRAHIIGESTILKLETERFLVVSAFTPGELLLAKLNRHIISEEVELEDQTASWQMVLLTGSDFLKCSVPVVKTEQPPEDQFSYLKNGYAFWFWTGSMDTLSCLCKTDQIAPVVADLKALKPNEMSGESFRRLRYEKALPAIPAEVGVSETPAEVGLSHLCSLRKGCYLGQEVVNRQSRLDRVVKRLVRVRLAALPDEKAERSIFAGASVVGELRGWTDEAPYIGLAVIKTKAMQESLYLGQPEGLKLALL